jgi:acyl-CoA thioester hydrolase
VRARTVKLLDSIERKSVIPTPFAQHRGAVQDAWIDANEHMNVAYYVVAFDRATDDFFDYVGLTRDYREGANCTTYALELHATYVRELKLGQNYLITTQLLDGDNKRLHFFHQMYNDTPRESERYLAATLEGISMHIDRTGPRGAPFPDAMTHHVQAIVDAHGQLPRPRQAGSVIGIRR